MIAPEEEQIRRFFETARRFEESEAPRFQTTLAGARRLAVSRSRMRVWTAVTVMFLFAALSVLIISRTRQEADLPPDRALLYWESPTEAYLSAPGEAVLTVVAAPATERARQE